MKKLNELKDYVPRHMRLGVCCSVPQFESFQDVVEEVPIVDKKSEISTQRVVKRCPTDEVMDKYKLSAFRLTALVESGVPLKLVNVNMSQNHTIDELLAVSQSIDDADKFVERVLEQRKERESWFRPDDGIVNDVNND